MENARSNKINLIVGTRGVGKTDFVKNLIADQRRNPSAGRYSGFEKQLVLDTFDSMVWRNLKTFERPYNDVITVPVLPVELLRAKTKEGEPAWKSGIYRIFSSDTDVLLAEIERNLFDAHLIMEDATKYVGSTLSREMKRFLLDSKQKNLDVTLIFHSLVSVPPALVRIADTLTLFKTNEGYVSFNKYPWPQIPAMMFRLKHSSNHFAHITINLN